MWLIDDHSYSGLLWMYLRPRSSILTPIRGAGDSIEGPGPTRGIGNSNTGCAPLLGDAGSPCNTMWPRPRLTCAPSGILIHPAVWLQQTWAKNWGLCPFLGWGVGAGSPSNTMWPGPGSTSVWSFILIYPTVWPQYCQYTNVTDRQDRRDNGPIA